MISSDVVGLGGAVMSAIGSQAVWELELVGSTSAVGFALVLFLFSPKVDVGARVACSEIEDPVAVAATLV